MTSEEREKMRARLEEAREAYHNLQLGQSAKVIVDQNGERVEFTTANSDRLRAYIYSMEISLGLHTHSGPMRAWM